jgi:hypothetical protein
MSQTRHVAETLGALTLIKDETAGLSEQLGIDVLLRQCKGHDGFARSVGHEEVFA